MQNLPRGARMSCESWAARHRLVGGSLWAAVPVLVLVGLLGPMPLTEALLLPLLVALFGVAARLVTEPVHRADLISVGLIGGAFAGVELSGGMVHAHLFILSAIALVALYQRWSPLLLAVGATVVHHLTVGLLAPERVFSMGTDPAMAGMHHPALGFWSVLVMVLTHAAAVVIEVVAILLWWHFAELAERELQAAQTTAGDLRREADTERAQLLEQQAAAERERAELSSQLSEQLTRDATEIRDRARATTEAVLALDQQALQLGEAVSSIARRCQEATETARTGQQTSESATEDVRRLEGAMAEIAEVNQMIAQLAAQTNLLSLNATIEAARAGDAGKGFAVVAQEVKALANETSASAEKVRGVIDGVVHETEKVARSFGVTTALVGQIRDLQGEIAQSMEDQAIMLAEVSRQATTAAGAADEITTSLEQMVGRR